jgi:hypothetical protein
MIVTNAASPIPARQDHVAEPPDPTDAPQPAPLVGSKPANDAAVDVAPASTRRSRARRWLLPAAAALCVVSWIALGAGVATGAAKSTMLVLATIAALATEGLVWLAAMLLGLRAFEARRYLFDRMRRLIPGRR